MRIPFTFISVLALSVMGCSETAGTGGAAGDGGSGGVGGEGGGGSTEARSLSVNGYDPDGNSPLAGVELCELDTTNCVMTDADGFASLVLPADGETAYTAHKEGWAPRLFTEVISPDSRPLMGLLMLPEEHVSEEHERVGSPYPMQGTGTVMVNIDPNFAGVMFELMNATGTAFYWDGSIWRTDLMATTNGVDAVGGFTEVASGVVEVEIGGTAAQGCTPTGGWPAEAENTLRVPVREGYTSVSRSTCPIPL